MDFQLAVLAILTVLQERFPWVVRVANWSPEGWVIDCWNSNILEARDFSIADPVLLCLC